MYLDDIISFGGTFDGALSNLTLIFERLRSYGLQLKSSKCHLFRVSVPFLGHIVGRRGLECDPTKIEDVKLWPVPDCLKSVRQFWDLWGIIDDSFRGLQTSRRHSDDIALLNVRCWLQWQCVYSLDHTYAGHVSLSGQIISRWCGCIDLKIRRA